MSASTGSAIDLKAKLAQIDELWSPRVIAELNDYQFKLAKLEGEFVWHKHDDTDEAFLVIDGELNIELRDRVVALSGGDLFVVPRGIEHRPVAPRECSVLLIEPRGTLNTGDAGGERTAAQDLWI
jgi:mannose-6-phosphate isomerase-like protein (cupin superfamily)